MYVLGETPEPLAPADVVAGLVIPLDPDGTPSRRSTRVGDFLIAGVDEMAVLVRFVALNRYVFVLVAWRPEIPTEVRSERLAPLEEMVGFARAARSHRREQAP